MAKARDRSQLSNLVKLKALLHKIKSLHVVFEVGTERFPASACSNVLIDETLGSNNIQFNRPGDHLTAVKAAGSLGGLSFQADTAGAAGNSITVRYTAGATAGSEVVTVVGNAITVQIASGVSTRTQVKAALDASSPAAALVDTSITSGATVVTAPAGPTSLSGGFDADALEQYDLSDITMIRRLRTKKWMIEINGNANPA